MAKAYLIGYNVASALGWAFVLYKVVKNISNGTTGKALWDDLSTTITVVQSAAALEIFHSLFGLVRSPLLPTIMQVFSRLIVLYMYMIPSNGCDGHWSLYLCIGSWALVEVPRYLFYTVSLNVKGEPHKIPSSLFWLRYNLFMVLYPSGITGELFQMYNAYGGLFHHTSSLFYRIVIFHHLLYVPLAPFMIFNMWTNKKRAYKKRKQSLNPRPLRGLIWPITDQETKARSTTKTNKLIWTSSISDVDKKLSDKCGKERNWRFKYQKHVMSNVELSCKSKKNALQIATAGLAKAYDLFEFKNGDNIISFKKAMEKGYIKDTFDTHIIKGNGKLSTELKVPYGGGAYQGMPYYLGLNDKTVLSGMPLREQLEKWVKYGTIEPSAAESIALVNTNRDKWLDLRNHYFVLLGASSAMGPLFFLLRHGANIIAVDLNRDFIWTKLFDAVKNTAGTLIFPVKAGSGDVSKLSEIELAKISGSDLLCDTPKIANWVTDIVKTHVKDKQLTIGNYTYLDGALHVQLSLACDGIIKRVCDEKKDAMIAFLCTPTDNHVVPKEAYDAAKESFKSRVPQWVKLFNQVSCGKVLSAPNYKSMRIVKQDKGEPLYIIDGIAVAQGPNYALAKRLQHWRAVIAYSEGHRVSSNVAPSTATESVVHNAQFAAAYGGMHHFQPMEVMYQRTSLAVMGSLLIHDLCNKDGAANPNGKIGSNLLNPFQLFSFGSFHGGVWRCSYKINDIGVPSALSFYISQYKVPVIIATLNIVLGTNWLLTGKFVPLV